MALFRRNRDGRGGAGARGISPEDLEHLRTWASTRVGIDGYLEPATVVNQTSLLLVDLLGEYTRRPVSGWREADAIGKELRIAVYDATETGYPRRMRERDEAMRKRAKREARERLRDEARRQHGRRSDPGDHGSVAP